MSDTPPDPAPAGPADEGDVPPGFRFAYAALLLAMFLGALDQTVFSTALPTIVGELHGIEHMAWVTTAYTLAATVVMPVHGRLGDAVGHKVVFLAAITAFVLGSVVCALAPQMGVLIAGRALQGLGGGGLMIASQAVIAAAVPPRRRAVWMAPMGAVFGTASVAGPLLGGWLTDAHSWRWALWVNVPLGLAAVVTTTFALRLPRRRARLELDGAGVAVMAVAVTATVLLATWGGTRYPWSSPVVLALAGVVVLGWGAFVLVERRAAQPVVPLTLFRSRVFTLATVIGVLGVALAMFAVVGYLPTYLQMVHGVSATASGLLLAPMIGGMIVTATGSGILMSRTGRYRVYPVVGCGLLTMTALALSQLGASSPLWLLCCLLALWGAGIGCMIQSLVLAVQNDFPLGQVGTVTAGTSFFREIGATLGAAVVGSAFAHRLSGALANGLDGPAAAAVGDVQALTPAVVRALPPGVRATVAEAYVDALLPLFLVLAPVFALALALSLALRDDRLVGAAPVPTGSPGTVEAGNR